MPLRPPFHQPTSIRHSCCTCQHRIAGHCAHPLDPREDVDPLAWCGWYATTGAQPFVVILREPGSSDPQPAEETYELVHINGQPAHVAPWQLRALRREGRL